MTKYRVVLGGPHPSFEGRRTVAGHLMGMRDERVGLRLSVLDQSPVAEGSVPADALQNSIALARRVDELGYRRFWMSEHHAMDTLACTAPEVMLARIGAETKRIRIGSGGIMLPH